MLKKAISKFEKVCAYTGVIPRILRSNVINNPLPKNCTKLIRDPRRSISDSKDDGGDKRRQEEENCQKIIDICFSNETYPSKTDNPDKLSAYEKEYLAPYLQPPLSEVAKCKTCEKLIATAFDVKHVEKDEEKALPPQEILLATTAKDKKEELTTKVETIDEANLVEGEPVKIDDKHIKPPRILANQMTAIKITAIEEGNAGVTGVSNETSKCSDITDVHSTDDQARRLADIGIIGNEEKNNFQTAFDSPTEVKDNEEECSFKCECPSSAAHLAKHICVVDELRTLTTKHLALPPHYYQNPSPVISADTGANVKSEPVTAHEVARDIKEDETTVQCDTDRGVICCEITLKDTFKPDKPVQGGDGSVQMPKPISPIVTGTSSISVQNAQDSAIPLPTTKNKPEALRNATNIIDSVPESTTKVVDAVVSQETLPPIDENMSLNRLREMLLERNKSEYCNQMKMCTATKPQLQKRKDKVPCPPKQKECPPKQKQCPPKPPAQTQCPKPAMPCPCKHPDPDPCPPASPRCPKPKLFKDTSTMLKYLLTLLVQFPVPHKPSIHDFESKSDSETSSSDKRLLDVMVISQEDVRIEDITKSNVDLMARDFQPWCPIPSWPVPRSAVPCPTTQCDKSLGCKLIPPPGTKSSCRDIDCRNNSNKLPPRRFGLPTFIWTLL